MACWANFFAGEYEGTRCWANFFAGDPERARCRANLFAGEVGERVYWSDFVGLPAP